MLKLAKAVTLVGMSSVYMMQIDCTYTRHGFSVFTSVPNLFDFITDPLGL